MDNHNVITLIIVEALLGVAAVVNASIWWSAHRSCNAQRASESALTTLFLLLAFGLLMVPIREFRSAQLSKLYREEIDRLCKTGRDRDGLQQIDERLDLAELHECVEAAKLGLKLASVVAVNRRVGFPAAPELNFRLLAEDNLSRALELRDRLGYRLAVPKEHLLFLAYHESLLTK